MTPTRPPPFDLDPRPVAAIFRTPVFNASETFVAAQAAGLVRYQPLVLGLEEKGHVPPRLTERILLPRNGRERLAARLGRWGGIARRLRPIAPVLIHAHYGPDGVRALPLARRLGIPLITSLRGYDIHLSPFALLASGRLSWMDYALRQAALAARCRRFLAVSEALRRKAVARGYPADRTFLLYNGVDLARFAGARPDQGCTILHVARLVEKKGTSLLLRAFAEARKSFPKASLAVIGDGPLRGSLERLSETLALGDSIRFLGEQPPAAVADWMRRSALLAAPSLAARDGDGEGLPNTVVEAAASGLPVVASDHAGIPEAVIDGRSGLIVPEGEAGPLARALCDLIAAPERRRDMGAAARALAEERFDMVRQIALLEEHYDSVLAEHSAGSF